MLDVTLLYIEVWLLHQYITLVSSARTLLHAQKSDNLLATLGDQIKFSF